VGYYYWCKENKSYKATRIRKIVNSGLDQVQRYISLLNKASVDELISPGLGIIGGWLILSAMKCQTDGDPLLIIDWNYEVFSQANLYLLDNMQQQEGTFSLSRSYIEN
jgi:hypothetical protein